MTDWRRLQGRGASKLRSAAEAPGVWLQGAGSERTRAAPAIHSCTRV
jgi:hypothetical protein